MALKFPTALFIFATLLLSSVVTGQSNVTAARGRHRASVGINYGRVGNNLPSPEQAVELLKTTTIRSVKIFDADATVLKAFANSGMEVAITFPNDQIYGAGRRALTATRWVRGSVLPFVRSGTKISYICVGNEILIDLRGGTRTAKQLVPAMTNIQAALARYGLDRIKVSTPHALNILNPSFPPSTGTFRKELAPYMKPMLDFLNKTSSPLMVNAYPYFAYRSDPKTNLDYVLFRKNNKGSFRDKNSGLFYTNMLEAQVDTVYAALQAAGYPNIRMSITETGWPSGGDSTSEPAATPGNAAAYNGGLASYIRSGRGTPMRPGFPLEAFIFALFDENQKTGPASEYHFGLFHADMSQSYNIGVQRKGANVKTPTPAPVGNVGSWCVAKSGVTQQQLQAALDYACGKADCSPIQPGKGCYNPNTLQAHASYAFNSYYQANSKQQGACDFSGTAMLTSSNPSYQGCSYPA